MFNVNYPTFSYVPTIYDPSVVQATSSGWPGPVPVLLPEGNFVVEADLASNLNLGGIGRVQSGRVEKKKEKRWARTKWSQEQEQTLAAAFAEDQEIGSRMSQLVEATGLPEKTIKVYFANHRARSKKSQKEDKPKKPGRPRKLTEVSEGYGSWEGSPSAEFASGLGHGQYMHAGYPSQNLDIQGAYSAPAQSQAQFASGNYCLPSQNYYSNPQGSWDYSNTSANYYPQMGYCYPVIPEGYCNNFVNGNNMPSGQIEQSPSLEACLETPSEDFLQDAMQIAGTEPAEEARAAPENSEAKLAEG
uniref:Homeobox domain-containing protein n=1 Tax=Bursaphelenchus xylophilus TaxID=6326 RepID=A0A1I7SK61_BURXY